MAEVSKLLNLAMRGLQFLWALLIMAISGNMIAQSVGGNPSEVNFAMFCAVFAMLSLFYLIPATLKEGFSFHPLILIAVDVLNTLFFFCGGVALAAALKVHSCSSALYVDTNRITNGTNPGNRSGRCHEAQAVDAFLWFGFAAFAVSAVLSGLQSRGGANLGTRRAGPSVSRV